MSASREKPSANGFIFLPKLQSNLLKTAILSVVVIMLAYRTLSHQSIKWLYTDTPIEQADWIVLLGGEPIQRAAMAAELYHQGIAPKVFISGGAECTLLLQKLTMKGVPISEIIYECQSQSTYENAIYTHQALASYNPKKIVLVTSWFHTSRAIRVFKKVWPNVEWKIYGGLAKKITSADEARLRVAADTLILEYVKTAWYKIRYQI